MASFLIAGVVFAAAFGGVVIGMLLQARLPAAHLAADSKEVIRLGTGLVATMAALVLGLLVGAANSAFNEQRTAIQQLALDAVVLDRTLARFGPEALPARQNLRGAMQAMVNNLWPDGSTSAVESDAALSASGGALYEAVRGLQPRDESQKFLHGQALQGITDMLHDRWKLAPSEDATLPIPFLVVLAFWLFVLFMSFGVFAPRNTTVVVVLFICALSVAGAVFLVVDLDQPFDGVVRISSQPLRGTLSDLTP